MKKNFLFVTVFLILALANQSCKTSYKSQSLEYQSYQINNDLKKDSVLINFLTPYKAKVNLLMNGVVGFAENNLQKKQPEGELGNFMVDAFFHMAKEKYNTYIDVAFMNHGGIRLNELPKGDVTTGRIFELMPFDNVLILQKVKGNILQEFLDLIASQGGCPVAGLTMQIQNQPAGKKAINVLIGGKKIELEKVYTIANSDYVANGGGDAEMLKSIPQISNGYLMRDALFDYIAFLKKNGKNINATIENRVSTIE